MTLSSLQQEAGSRVVLDQELWLAAAHAASEFILEVS
jgi:hypothetical protein